MDEGLFRRAFEFPHRSHQTNLDVYVYFGQLSERSVLHRIKVCS